MYTITTLRSSPKSQRSFKDMLDPKRSKFGPKRAQIGQELNVPDSKPKFSKRRPLNYIYKKSAKFNEQFRR